MKIILAMIILSSPLHASKIPNETDPLGVFNSVSPTPSSKNLRPPELPEPTKEQKEKHPSVYDAENADWIYSSPRELEEIHE